MAFFGSLTAVCLVVSAGMFLPILLKFFRTGLVPNFPTLIVSGFIALTAIISWFAGMLLSTLAEKDRQAYEFRLQVIRWMERNEQKG